MIPEFLNSKAKQYEGSRKAFLLGVFIFPILLIVVTSAFTEATVVGNALTLTFAYMFAISIFVTGFFIIFTNLWSAKALNPVLYRLCRLIEWSNGIVLIVFIVALVCSYPFALILAIINTN